MRSLTDRPIHAFVQGGYVQEGLCADTIHAIAAVTSKMKKMLQCILQISRNILAF